VWSPDGQRIIFQSSADLNQPNILAEVPANGATPPQQFLPAEPDATLTPLDWSRDGKFLLFRKSRVGSLAGDFWTLSMTDLKQTPYLISAFNKTRPRFSGDGHWVAYDAAESDINQVFIQSFPDSKIAKYPVSTEGGVHPLWRGDGRELFYLDLSGQLL